MDKYNSGIAKFVGFFFARKGEDYAITLGQTAHYSCDESQVSDIWRAHENEHKRQWARDGKFKFLSRYLWQYITKGYANIDYEIEAQMAARAALNKA